MKIKKIKPLQLALIVFCCGLAGIIIWGGIYCSVNDESPSEMLHDIVTPDEEQLVGKWQEEKAIVGYEFFDDGTYDYYTLGNKTTKYYEISGNKLTLKSGVDNRKVVYKYKVNGDKLTLTLIESEGVKRSGKEGVEYKRVKHFNFKSLTESLKDLADALSESTTQNEGD